MGSEYKFFVSGDAEDWTEEEKQLVIKRHEQQKKEFMQHWEGVKWETVGDFLAIKTGKEENNE